MITIHDGLNTSIRHFLPILICILRKYGLVPKKARGDILNVLGAASPFQYVYLMGKKETWIGAYDKVKNRLIPILVDHWPVKQRCG